MKNSILTIAALTLIAGSSLTSCNSSAEKVDNAKMDVIEAQETLDKARATYEADRLKFKLDMDKKIDGHNQSIIDFNAKIAMEKKDVKAEYQKKITALEQRNNNLKIRLNNFQAQGKENWEAFKSEFSRDLDDLGKAFDAFTVKKVN